MAVDVRKGQSLYEASTLLVGPESRSRMSSRRPTVALCAKSVVVAHIGYGEHPEKSCWPSRVCLALVQMCRPRMAK